MKQDLVQIRNPKTNRYIKIDKAKGVILSSKSTTGPYKNIRIADKPTKVV